MMSPGLKQITTHSDIRVLHVMLLLIMAAGCAPAVREKNSNAIAGSSCDDYAMTYEHNPASNSNEAAVVDRDDDGIIEGITSVKFQSSDYRQWLNANLTNYVPADQVDKYRTPTGMARLMNSLYRWCVTRPEQAFTSALPAVLQQ